MSKIPYTDYENNLLKLIKQIPNGYTSTVESVGLEGQAALRSRMFDFTVEDHSIYDFSTKQAQFCLGDIIEAILLNLYSEKGIPAVSEYKSGANDCKKISNLFADFSSKPLFTIVVLKDSKPTLYLFKEFGINYIPEWFVTQVLSDFKIERYHYVSLVEEYAYAAKLNHNNDLADKSRGTNDYSFKDYFIDEFGESEYYEFLEFSRNATALIRDYLGFSIVKTLTPHALFSFKKVVGQEILDFDYSRLIAGRIDETGIVALNRQFFEKKYYLAALSEPRWQDELSGDCLFSESFLTAEWLYMSLPTDGRTDLTAIALGYFKAIEELLFAFVMSHIGEYKWIDTDNMRNGESRCSSRIQRWQSYLTPEKIRKKKQYIMLERLINFISDFDDLLNDMSVKHTLLETLSIVKPLRNGFSHKDNLHDISVIEKARENTYLIFYLLLGSMRTTQLSREVIGIPDEEDHFFMLCNYVCTHTHSSSYCWEDSAGELFVGVGHVDDDAKYDRSGKASFSGLYMNLLVGFPPSERILPVAQVVSLPKRLLRFDKNTVPQRIYEGTFTPCAEGMDLGTSRTLIWEKGIFLLDTP